MKRLIFISLLCFIIGWGANVVHADPVVLGFPPERLNALIATEAAAESYTVINTLLGVPVSFGQWNGSYNASNWSMNFIGTDGGRTLNISLIGMYTPADASNPFPTISWVGVYTFNGLQVATSTGSAILDPIDWTHTFDTILGVGGIIGAQALTGIPTGGTVAIFSVVGITGVIARTPIANAISEQVTHDQNTGNVGVSISGEPGEITTGHGTIGPSTISLQVNTVPEPTTLLLLSTGLAGVAIKTRKRLKGRKRG